MKSVIENGCMELKSSIPNWVVHFEVGYKFKSFKNRTISVFMC